MSDVSIKTGPSPRRANPRSVADTAAISMQISVFGAKFAVNLAPCLTNSANAWEVSVTVAPDSAKHHVPLTPHPPVSNQRNVS